MVAIAGPILDEEIPRARVALLLHHFSELGDDRESWRVMYPLREVLLLVTCATIASCDDFDDIVAWGKHHLAFLRRFSEFHHGIPCERWLRHLVNRIDPILFGRCFKNRRPQGRLPAFPQRQAAAVTSPELSKCTGMELVIGGADPGHLAIRATY